MLIEEMLIEGFDCTSIAHVLNLFASHHFESVVQSSGVGMYGFFVIGCMLVSICGSNIDFHGFPFQSGIISSTSS